MMDTGKDGVHMKAWWTDDLLLGASGGFCMDVSSRSPERIRRLGRRYGTQALFHHESAICPKKA